MSDLIPGGMVGILFGAIYVCGMALVAFCYRSKSMSRGKDQK